MLVDFKSKQALWNGNWGK